MEDIDKLVDTWMHEIEHARNGQYMAQFNADFRVKVHGLVNEPGPQDATGLAPEYLQEGRRQEALAELAGMNGLADRMRAEGKGRVVERKLAERLVASSSCVERNIEGEYNFKSDIHFDNKAESVPTTPGNIEAVAKCFFDVDRGRSNYNARYVAGAISEMARVDIAGRIEDPWEPHARIHIDLAALGVTLDDLRKQPLDFGPHPPGPFQFTDTSNGQKKIVSLMHNGGRVSGSPEADIAAEAAPPVAAPLLSDPAHPGHAMYAQTLQAFAVSPRIQAAGWANDEQQLIAANLVAGTLSVDESRGGRPQQVRIDRVDAATIATDGSYVTIMQHMAQNSTTFRFGLPMEQARAGSIEAASQQAFAGLQQQQVLEAARQAERDRNPQPEPEGPVR